MPKSPNGFTLIELLVVIGIVVLIAGFIFVGLLNYGYQQRFIAQVTDVQLLIAETRQRTITAETNQNFGVRFETDRLIVFEGSYSTTSPGQRVYVFSGISISPSLTNATNTITFTRLTGAPSATGTILIIDGRTNSTTSIQINQTGLVQLSR
jgi:prepilin-type N-terminal cleavage/methylation domain-containing protein